MSPSSPPTSVLRIEAGDGLTEVRVLDANFGRVQMTANTGNVDVLVAPGIYEVGFRVAGCWLTEHVLVREHQDVVTVRPPAAGTAGPRESAPRTVTETRADAASILVELCGPCGGALPRAEAERLSVVLLGLDDAPLEPLYTKALNPGTWRYGAPPGHWRLRVTEPMERPPFELPITAPPGRTVQLVLPVQRQAEGEAFGLDIDRCRLRLLPQGRREPVSDEMVRREDEALSSLASRRHLYGEGIDALIESLIDEKSENPMLGIYAGHLCATRPGDAAFLERMIEGLDRVLGGPQTVCPDVTALKLRHRMINGGSLDDIAPLAFPPSLVAGWTALLAAARIRPELIPEGSLCARIGGRIWSTDLWLAWSSAPPDSKLAAPLKRSSVRSNEGDVVANPAAFAEACSTIRAALLHLPLREWYRAARDDLERRASNATDGIAWEGSPEELAPDELAVATVLRPVAADEAKEARVQRIGLSYSQPAGRCEDSNTLAGITGLPRCTVEAAALSLASKFKNQAERLQLDLKEGVNMASPEIIIPYDPAFLGDGFVVPLPTLSDAKKAEAFADAAVLDYTHFSLVMHRARRVAIYTANNIDAARKVQVGGGLQWRLDERVGEHQVGSETYDNNQIDKGHLVRREDVLWGTVPEARAANKATYFYTNAAPQHQNFNQDEWKSLEDWVLSRAPDFSYRVCVFTGPVLHDSDPLLADLPPHLRHAFAARPPAQLPAAFWKIIVVRDAEAGGDDLAALGFAMKQSEMWNDKHGRRLLNLKTHQVPISAIEEWTGLDFGVLKDVDELAFTPSATRTLVEADSNWPRVADAEDIIWSGPDRRARGLRAVRLLDPGDARSARSARSFAPSTDCCKGDDFDARTAVGALSRDLTRLTGLIASMSRQGGLAGDIAPTAEPRGIGDAEDPTKVPADDSRVQELTQAAPPEMQDGVRDYARALIGQGEIARGVRPPPTSRELERIVGGENVPPGGFPHCVCIGTATGWMCTGALVAPRVVLTAAHCGAAITRIMAGGNQVQPWLSPDARVVAVQKVAIHPDYKTHPLSENDITVLILAGPANLPPAPLATAGELAAAASVELVGFGYNDPNLPVGFGTKRRVTIALPPLMRRTADENLGQLEAKLGFHGEYEFVCGRKALGKDSCNGDSGGPAYIGVGGGFKLAGLTSRATREAVQHCGDGGVYVRPDCFRGWIDSVVAGAGLPPLAW